MTQNFENASFETLLAAVCESSHPELASAIERVREEELAQLRSGHEKFVEEIYQGYEEELEKARQGIISEPKESPAEAEDKNSDVPASVDSRETYWQEKLAACAELVQEAQVLAERAVKERDVALAELADSTNLVQVAVAQSIANLELETTERIKRAVENERNRSLGELRDLTAQVSSLQKKLAAASTRENSELKEALLATQELVRLVEDLESQLAEARSQNSTKK